MNYHYTTLKEFVVYLCCFEVRLVNICSVVLSAKVIDPSTLDLIEMIDKYGSKNIEVRIFWTQLWKLYCGHLGAGFTKEC